MISYDSQRMPSLNHGHDRLQGLALLRSSVNEITKMHHESEVEFIVMLDALGEFLGRKIIFSDETGLAAILAVSHRAEAEERATGLGLGRGQMGGNGDGDPSGEDGNVFQCFIHGLLIA